MDDRDRQTDSEYWDRYDEGKDSREKDAVQRHVDTWSGRHSDKSESDWEAY